MNAPLSPVVRSTHPMSFGVVVGSTDVDQAYALTLQAVLDRGHEVVTGPASEPLKRKKSREIIAFQVFIEDIRRRVLFNPHRALNLYGAVARFTWMVAANNRLEDIAFYESRVTKYSDNQLTIPGSDYGMRIFESRPGLNQLQGVVNAIQQEEGSRRAACVVWRPEDAIRQSRDIPCAFGNFYSSRDGQLISITVMRSNNAFLLFPYNVFEFSLLSEMVAASVGVQPGPYIHFASSMHVFNDQIPLAQKTIDAYYQLPHSSSLQMPPMPQEPSPFEQTVELARLEAHLRHEYALQPLMVLFERGDALHDYWRAFYNVLLVYALARANRRDEAIFVKTYIPDYFPLNVLPEGETKR